MALWAMYKMEHPAHTDHEAHGMFPLFKSSQSLEMHNNEEK